MPLEIFGKQYSFRITSKGKERRITYRSEIEIFFSAFVRPSWYRGMRHSWAINGVFWFRQVKAHKFFGAMTGERITMLATKVICFSSMFRLTSMNVNKLHFCLDHKYFLIEFLATIDWQLNWMANWICFDIAPSVSACACLPSNPAFRFLSLLRKKKLRLQQRKTDCILKVP